MKHPILTRLASLGFSIGIFFLAITAATALVFGTSTALKGALHDSGVYTSLSEQFVQEASDATTSEAGLPLDDSDVQGAAAASFTPKMIQRDVEKALDGSYEWLEGKTEKPDITIDLNPYVNKYVQTVGDQAVQRAQGLPTCTLEQLRQLDPNNLDISTMPCLPPGMNIASTKDAAIAKLLASNEFLRDPVVSTDSLPKDQEGKTAVDRAHNLPRIFQWSLRVPRFFAGLTLASALAIGYLTRSDWRQGVRRLARPLLATGVALLIIVFITRFFFDRASQPDGLFSRLAGGDFQSAILSFVSILQQLYTGQLLVFGAIYIAVGVAGLIIARFVKPQATAPLDSATGTSVPLGSPHSSPDSNNGVHSNNNGRHYGDNSSNSSDSSDSSGSDGGGSSSSD